MDSPCIRGPGAAAVVLAAACAGATVPYTEPAAPAPTGAVDVSLFLVGDAGEPDDAGEPTLAALRTAVSTAPGERVVVFLGDNVYPHGLPDSAAADRAEAERRLAMQLAAGDNARILLIPGNHDWDHGGADGWAAVRRQEAFVAARGAVLLPGGGCPGPAVIDVGTRLRLVLIDTQWWLHGGARPEGGDGGCGPGSRGGVVDSLRGALRDAGSRHVAVLGHHPLATGGPHGGHFTWREHIFPLTEVVPWLWLPLPVIGSAYPLARMNGWSDQDMSGRGNREMRDSLVAAFATRPPLVYAAGHEHAVQVLDGVGARHLIVSGAGRFAHTSSVTAIPGTRFAASTGGFARLDVLTDGRVRLGVILADAAGRGEEAFSMWLDTTVGP
ncbi:MAG TPA: metallophosphoesterase [Gemmatimonadales bacterium]|nr:metallophosphoesterase [Gemmatimonadales bacterium]